MYLLLNLPVRCPRSGTRNTTLETHTCKSLLLYLGCKNCRRCLCLPVTPRESPEAPRPIKTLGAFHLGKKPRNFGGSKSGISDW